MKKFSKSIVGAILCSSMPLFAGGFSVDGGDAFKIGNEITMFENVECDQSFQPDSGLFGEGIDDTLNQEILEAWGLIDAQLKALHKTLPSTSNYIRNVFIQGYAHWCFAKEGAEIKDVADEGISTVVIKYKKIQAAININGRDIRISRDVWDLLSKKSRAYLLTHEAAWSVVGSLTEFKSGAQIRNFTIHLLGTNFEFASPYNLIKGFQNVFTPEQQETAKLKKFFEIMEYDASQNYSESNIAVSLVPGENPNDYLFKYSTEEDQENIVLYFTKLNPNPAYRHMVMLKNGFMQIDSNSKWSYDTSADRKPQTRFGTPVFRPLPNKKTLCPASYAGLKGRWRLPTDQEVKHFVDSGLFHLNFLTKSFQQRRIKPSLETERNLEEKSVTSSLAFFPFSPTSLVVKGPDRPVPYLIDSESFAESFTFESIDQFTGPYHQYFCVLEPSDIQGH